jgi:subtilisin family serine protease
MMNYLIKVAVSCAMIAAMFVAGAALAAGPDKDRYIVSFQDVGKGKAALRAAGADVLLDLPRHEAAAVHIPARALNGLGRNPNIEYIERDTLRFPMAETLPWGIPAVQADGLSEGTPAVNVCIIDSGYDNTHLDLPDLTGPNSGSHGGADSPLADTCFHGTHVAGTIAAVSGNNLGVVGVVPGKSELTIVKVFDGENCAWAYSSDLVAALDLCLAESAQIINMSLGGRLKSRTEQRAFQAAYNDGVLSIAAAGNDGTTRHSYPASYPSVVSVGAVDSALTVADFSQQTNQVELAAPGVAVRSTVSMGTGFEENLTVGGSAYEATGMEGSPDESATGPLFRCNKVDGLGSPGDCEGASGKICLISRGDITFAAKAEECKARSGVGVVIFNNSAALFSGTFGETPIAIPAVGVSGTDGAILEDLTGQSATVSTTTGNYAFYDGTSMATPHVAGVAALVWSQDSTCTNAEIRDAMTSTALDLGPGGRDDAYGYGLVQAADAALALSCGGDPGDPGDPGGCSLEPQGASCSADSQCCSSACKGKPGSKTCK